MFCHVRLFLTFECSQLYAILGREKGQKGMVGLVASFRDLMVVLLFVGHFVWGCWLLSASGQAIDDGAFLFISA